MAYVLPLLSALRVQGCDAHVLCLGGGGLAVEAAGRGLPCDILPMGSPWDVRVVPSLRSYLARGGWEVVHAHGMRANLPVRTILRLALSRPALFTTVHSDLALDYAHPLKSRLYVALDRLSAGPVDGFFCVSADLAGRLAARGIPASRIQVVYPGIEPVGQGVPVGGPRATAEREAAAEGSGTAADRIGPTEVVGTVARLVGVKDVGLLLEAAGLLRARRPALRVIVVGDGPERAALER